MRTSHSGRRSTEQSGSPLKPLAMRRGVGIATSVVLIAVRVSLSQQHLELGEGNHFGDVAMNRLRDRMTPKRAA